MRRNNTWTEPPVCAFLQRAADDWFGNYSRTAQLHWSGGHVRPRLHLVGDIGFDGGLV